MAQAKPRFCDSALNLWCKASLSLAQQCKFAQLYNELPLTIAQKAAEPLKVTKNCRRGIAKIFVRCL